MRTARVFVDGLEAGVLQEIEFGSRYAFEYLKGYDGQQVSVRMPTSQSRYLYNKFPPFFEGVLPEGYQLDSILRSKKIDRNDLFSLLMVVGDDLVGNITVKEIMG
ncbi:MAG: HipA N-terminal domain-containing protein [Bacteroidales bacterium]